MNDALLKEQISHRSKTSPSQFILGKITDEALSLAWVVGFYPQARAAVKRPSVGVRLMLEFCFGGWKS